MRTRELIESIALARSASGSIPKDAFREFGERIFYVPLQTVRNADDSGAAKKIRFLAVDREGGKVVPAFSTEDLLFDWSSGNYQFLPVAGADLVHLIPSGLALEVDIGTEHSLLLNPTELKLVLLEEEEEPIAPVRPTTPREERRTQVLSLKQPPTEREIEDRLSSLFVNYPAITEAYYVVADGTAFGGLLGLLVAAPGKQEGWNTEQRFSLIEQIAEMSRALYGYAGAIEVYDDLTHEGSRSWDLFKSHQLFYRKDAAREKGGNDVNFAGAEPASWSTTSRNDQAELVTSAARAGIFQGVAGVVPGLRLKLNDRK